jgi:endo-1,4-beta-xylanase
MTFHNFDYFNISARDLAFAAILSLVCCLPVSAQQVKYTFPEIADLAVTEGLQNPFIKPDGTAVQTKEEWPAQREYLKAMLVHYQYGTMPPTPEDAVVENVSSEEILDGKGILDLFNITITRDGKSVTLHCSLYRPNKPGKFPVVIKNDRRVTEKDDILAKAFEMDYAISKYAREDLATDNRKFVRNGGVYELYPEYTWGTIAVWAWGYQLVIDAFEEMGVIDMDKIVTTGHSRGGKTALAGAIFDERVAIAGPNSSGLGGTASARIYETGKRQQRIENHVVPHAHWWCAQWYTFVNNEEVMPFDAHFNKIVLAPRGLHNAHATNDYWANPLGTELTHLAAKKVYKWLGVEENIGLHWRPGGHAQNYDDWVALLDFADLYFYKRDNGNEFDRLVYPDYPLPVDWDTP